MKSILAKILAIVAIILLLLAAALSAGIGTSAIPAMFQSLTTISGITAGGLLLLGAIALSLAFLIDPVAAGEILDDISTAVGGAVGGIIEGVTDVIGSGLTSGISSFFRNPLVLGLGIFGLWYLFSDGDDNDKKRNKQSSTSSSSSSLKEVQNDY